MKPANDLFRIPHSPFRFMKVRLTKDFRFESAQTLPCVPEGHKCRQMHGHSFKVEISVEGEVDPATGWFYDHAKIGAAMKPHLAPEALPRTTSPAGREDDPVPARGAEAVGDVDTADRDDLLSVFDEVDDEPSPADPWFLAAWAVAVLAVVIGGAFWWAGMMAENPFSGVNQSDRWLQYVGWVVAPPLVEGGLIGIVAMLVWTGIRRARRQRGSS